MRWLFKYEIFNVKLKSFYLPKVQKKKKKREK